jgi:hypothetical protein
VSDVARVKAEEKIFPEILRDYFKSIECEDSYCNISGRSLREVLRRIALDVKRLAGCKKVRVTIESYLKPVSVVTPIFFVTAKKPVTYLTIECWKEPGKEPEKFSLRLSSDEPFRIDPEEGTVLVWKPRAPDLAFEKHRREYEL